MRTIYKTVVVVALLGLVWYGGHGIYTGEQQIKPLAQSISEVKANAATLNKKAELGKKTILEKGEFNMADNTTSSTWDKTKESVKNAGHTVVEKSEDIWDKTKEMSAEAWDKTKEVVSSAKK